MNTQLCTKTALQLKRDEGVRYKPYRDTEGYLTIGVGINLDDGLSEEEIQNLLEGRIHKRYLELCAAFPIVLELNEARQGALLNMIYQLGLPRLMGFHKMWLAINAKDFQKAASEALDSKWAKQVPVRAKRVTAQLEKGVWI